MQIARPSWALWRPMSSSSISATACSGLAEAHALLVGYEASGELSEYDRAHNLEPVAEMLESC